ncbi:hypothetical protein CBR_g30276 [Chara braunii]|uniref:HAT C-terminal dimerisation domain-containing protein n=1 Tax=Chara braunii TaxID=69332 RepID=A0A388LCG0_CHABU|nr:hypothetical protein CBR_g30276 [Chara braunii]|eukprot:GBG80015.1 hypothetical protein CBR_g30276 [Chara braunii]
MATGEKPPFDPAPEAKQMELEKNKPAYRWLLHGQEAEPLGYNNYWHKCKMCGRLWTTSYTHVVAHFTARRDPRSRRTGEILHVLANKGAKIECPITRRIIQLYQRDNNIADGSNPQPVVDTAEEGTLADFIVSPSAPGREAVGESVDGPGGVTDDRCTGREGGADPSVTGSVTTRSSTKLQQASIRRWTENTSQQRLDVVWGFHLYEHGASFNYMTGEKTQELHDLHNNSLGEVEAVVDIMYPVYDLLRKMDKSRTVPYQLWGFEDALIKQMATITSITPARQESIAKKVRKRCKMMCQPVHAANLLFNPAKRDPRWLHDPRCPLVQNAMKFSLSQCKEGAIWGCKEHLHLWDDMKLFHKEPQGNSSLPLAKQDSLWTDFAKFDNRLDKHTASAWWSCHGKSHPNLQRIAVRVTAMWSTTTLCERNWSTLDLVHEKRRNQLSSDTINKLVYVHWNLQLLKVKNKKAEGFIDMWADFFGADDPLLAADPVIHPDDAQPSAEKVAQRDRLRKVPYGRLPKVGRVDESSETGNSDDGEDLVWRGKGKKRKEKEYTDDEVVRAMAQALAKRDHAIVMQRVEKEAARRVTVPFQTGERGGYLGEGLDAAPTETGSGAQTAIVATAAGGQQTEVAVGATTSGSQTGHKLTETQQQRENTSDELNEEEQEDGHGARGRPNVAHVYKRRTHEATPGPPLAVPTEESQPDFPTLVVELQHDNLEKSTVGRKRKVVEQAAPIATAKRGRGRPQKPRPETVCQPEELAPQRQQK